MNTNIRGTKRSPRLSRLLFVITIDATFAVTASAAHAAGIVPDGGTATAVITSPAGRQTVNIAPTIGGVSNNTYTSFNVSKAGADLNNVGINARTIVNQVTSTNPASERHLPMDILRVFRCQSHRRWCSYLLAALHLRRSSSIMHACW